MSDKPGNAPNPADFFNWLSQAMNPGNSLPTGQLNPGSLPDSLAFFKNFSEKNQEAWANFMQNVVATPEFAKMFGQTANSSAAYRTMVRQTAKSYLEAANMPSRDDLTRVAEQIVTLDAKVDDLVENLTDHLGRIADTVGRVTTALEGLQEKINSSQFQDIGPRLAALEAQISRLENQFGTLPAPGAALPAPKKAGKAPSKAAGKVKTTKVMEDIKQGREVSEL